MKTFHLKIREHLEFGGLGIAFNSGRDYFQPAVNGLQLAHDILEHTAEPHPNGYIDELMALGGIIAGRMSNGWTTDFGRRITYGDLSSDIFSITYSALSMGDEICPKVCKSYIQDRETMEEIRRNVKRGLVDAINENRETNYETLPSDHGFDVDSIIGWICKGHQLYRKRFNNVYDVSTYLFDRIAILCDNWLKRGLEGETAKLMVDFASLNAQLITEEW